MSTKVSSDYLRFLETFAVYAEACGDVARIENDVKEELAAVIEGHKTPLLQAMANRVVADEALKQWAQLHPEWFAGKKTLNTPHGTISKRESKALEVADELVTMRAIVESRSDNARLVMCFKEKDLPGVLMRLQSELLHAAAPYLNVEITINKEACEKLPETVLTALGIVRKKTEAMTVKPLEVDLGKAVEAKPEAVKAGAVS